ncbi:NUDIX domain-containing protein [Streptococcus parauberis]|uniref:Hydrolase, NUDIX family n=1 Tax=Streptococcus parauberis NCFD 2020 TaxID=873447 RepID=F1Z2L2_9STRE|nr:NUDIX domain-containing protein [Streptococcus parauberis]EGE54058.1 hydrolase, NUDIX family [Streptococcus parauberis NCFD 2020]
MANELRSMASIYLRRGNEILLLFRQGSRVVNDLWISSAGGHFEPFELDRPKKCALRELEEELNITLEDISDLKLKYITLRNVNNEIRQNYYYFAELRPEFNNKLSSNEGLLKWFDLSELPFRDMPLTAKEVLHHYVTHTNDNNLYGGMVINKMTDFVRLY